MVVDKPRACDNQGQGCQEKQIWRVTDVYHIDTPPEADGEGQPQLRQDCYRVLEEIRSGATRLRPRRVSVDMNAIEELTAARVILCAGADDMYLVPCSVKSQRFLPDASIERHGKVLDENKNPQATVNACVPAHADGPRLSTASQMPWSRAESRLLR